jgi:uncharacterized membrane protein YgcG
MSEDRHPSPTDQVKQLYEDSEKRASRAFEELVSRDSFGEVLARVTENVVGIIKIGNDAFDLILRNLRLAGRQDITRLGRQLARTEDKLELVLQQVEHLQERLEQAPQPSSSSGSSRNGGNGGDGRSTGRARAGRSRGGGGGS